MVPTTRLECLNVGRCSSHTPRQTLLPFPPTMSDLSPPPLDFPARHQTASPKNGNGATVSHRSSFVEGLRHSPRSQRHPSFTQAALQDLINHPPNHNTSDPRFAGRDWRRIRVGELVQKPEVRWAELDMDVQQATSVCAPLVPPSGPSTLLAMARN